MITGLEVKYLLFLSDFKEICTSPTVFLKKTQIPIFMKFLWEPSPSMRTDKHDEANTRF